MPAAHEVLPVLSYGRGNTKETKEVFDLNEHLIRRLRRHLPLKGKAICRTIVRSAYLKKHAV